MPLLEVNIMAKVKSFIHSICQSIEDAQLRKARALIAEYKKTGFIGGWQ